MRGIALAPEGNEIAIGAAVGDIMIAPITTMKIGLELAGHTAGVRRMAYSSDGRVLASQSDDSTIRVRKVEDGRTLHILHVPPDDPADGGVLLSEDGTRLISRGARRIIVWDLPPEPSLVLRGHRNYVYTVAFSPDGALLATGPFQGDRVRLWDPCSGEALAAHTHPGRARSLRFTDDGARLQIRGGRTQDWDTATGTMSDVSSDADSNDSPTTLDSDAQGSLASDHVAASTSRLEAVVPQGAPAILGNKFLLQLRRTGSSEAFATLSLPSSVTSTAFSPMQDLLAVGCENGEIVIWDVAGRQPLAELHRHAGRVYTVAFSPDGRRLASGGNDNTLRLWDTATWDQVLERHEHESYIHALAFSPDGTQIATASGDMTVRVWDSLTKGERLAQVRADRARRDEWRPRVAALLEAKSASDVAGELRADRTLDEAGRRAALRVLLELTTSAPDDAQRTTSERTSTAAQPARPFSASLVPDVDEALVTKALELAGPNRPQIEQFLNHFDHEASSVSVRDPQMRLAARWLVANMPGKGYSRIRLVTSDGREVPFDIAEYRNVAEAQARMEALEREYGSLEFRAVEFIPDLVAITADHLIENHELAFDAWRSAPWGESISFETFLERILPYRATNELLDPAWRAAAREKVQTAIEMLRRGEGRAPTLAEAAQATIKATKPWIKFRPIYYLHPEDQSWTEMWATRAGRCEDETNIALFAGRAAGVPLAGDSTPFWADRDNNHAWIVALDGTGKSARTATTLAHRAAKVVRRGFALQPDSLGVARRAGEVVPAWLADPTSLDVTAEYVAVSDVIVSLGNRSKDERFAYLCVFNGGAWRAVHWSEVTGATATFTDMGRGALYLPAWYGADGVRPAGAPLVLTTDGAMQSLTAAPETVTLELTTSVDESTRSLENTTAVRVRVAADTPIELLVWDVELGTWRSHGQRTVTSGTGGTFDEVPLGCLYRLRTHGNRDLDRPFTIENGVVVHW